MRSRIKLGVLLLALLLGGALWFASGLSNDAADGPRPEPTAPSSLTLVPVPPPESKPIAPPDPAGDPLPTPGGNASAPVSLPEDPLGRFEQGNSDQRTRAIRELGRMAIDGDSVALQALIDALQDPEAQVRQVAVHAIGNLRDPSLVPLLAPLVNDPEEDIREDMIKSLAKMRSPAASDLLEELVDDEDSDVVEDAIQALVSADGRNSIRAVREVSMNADPWLAAKAGLALRSFGDDAGADAALERVAEGLESSEVDERRNTVGWIAEIGGDTAISYLQDALHDPSDVVQQDAARAIRRLSRAESP